MSKIFLSSLFLCFILFSITSAAQLTNTGQPKSWTNKTAMLSVDHYLMPSFDMKKQNIIDEINDATGMQPWQFGFEHNVNYNLHNSGTWTNLENGDRIWQIEFESKGAITMNLLFVPCTYHDCNCLQTPRAKFMVSSWYHTMNCTMNLP